MPMLTLPRSFVLAFRIMKLIIAERGNNAWLSHGTPHLNVRNDYADTATGIRPKQTFGDIYEYVVLHPRLK